jgi:hypothetical protein
MVQISNWTVTIEFFHMSRAAKGRRSRLWSTDGDGNAKVYYLLDNICLQRPLRPQRNSELFNLVFLPWARSFHNIMLVVMAIRRVFTEAREGSHDEKILKKP